MRNSAIDHRSIVAKRRRVQMRERLIEAATLVFAERGPEQTVIDHIIIEAGVSRGSFYNYFRSIDELLEAAKLELANETLQLVASAVADETDPAVSIAFGLASFIDVSMRFPLYLEFTAKLGTRGLGQGSIVREATPDVLCNGFGDGRFCQMPEQVALDILETTGLAILRRLLAGDEVDMPAYVAAMLRMLGVAPEEATRIASLPVPHVDVPDDHLLARAMAARQSA